MVKPTTCTKCGGRMEKGSALTGSSQGGVLVRWIEGAPERSIWSGMKTKGLKVLPISSYRCTRCGFLENYAND